jgi:hypothetical protein
MQRNSSRTLIASCPHFVVPPIVRRCLFLQVILMNTRKGQPHGLRPASPQRMPQTLIEEADAWATANNTVRSEAIRRLVELGLKVKSVSEPRWIGNANIRRPEFRAVP